MPLGIRRLVPPAWGLLLLCQVHAIAQTPEPEVGTFVETVERLVFEDVNEERTRRGLLPLEPDPALIAIARRHSVDMLQAGYLDHIGSDGRGPRERAAKDHRTLVGQVSENVWSGILRPDRDAFEVAARVRESIMNSVSHRDNLLTENLTHVGIGVYREPLARGSGFEYRATQLFASVEAYLDEPVPETLFRSSFTQFNLTDVDGKPSGARYFDLWSETDRQVVFGPARLLLTRILAEPGTYRLRFYYPLEGRRYRLIYGPVVDLE